MLGMDDGPTLGPTPMDTSMPKESPSYEQVNLSTRLLSVNFKTVLVDYSILFRKQSGLWAPCQILPVIPPQGVNLLIVRLTSHLATS